MNHYLCEGVTHVFIFVLLACLLNDIIPSRVYHFVQWMPVTRGKHKMSFILLSFLYNIYLDGIFPT